MIANLDQTLELVELRGLVNFEPITLPRLLIHDDKISRPMTTVLVNTEYVCLFDMWAQLFDKWKRALTCALLPW